MENTSVLWGPWELHLSQPLKTQGPLEMQIHSSWLACQDHSTPSCLIQTPRAHLTPLRRKRALVQNSKHLVSKSLHLQNLQKLWRSTWKC